VLYTSEDLGSNKYGKRVLDSLSNYGKSGCGIISLTNRISIPQSSLRNFLSTSSDFSCKINSGTKYATNSFGKYKRSVDDTLSALRIQQNKSKFWDYYAVALVALVVGYLIGRI
jgi:hypothetical protein